MNFRDRHIVVTGGTGALGTAVVAALVEAGATCHVPHRRHVSQDYQFRTHEQVELRAVELSDETAIRDFFSSVPRLWASIHVAGGFAPGKLSDTDRAVFLQQIDANLTSCFLCCRAAVRAMLGSGKGGRIVNVAARPALEWRGGAGMAAYTASKAAVAALTVAVAEEVAGDGILVNAVAPSIMDTAANRQAMPNADHSAWPKVEEVASTICFLASPENRVTRGAIVPVYGRT